MIEKLKNKTNINAEEAKEALEKNNWDMLDAMVFLETEGIIKNPDIGIYNTKENNSNENYSKNNADSSEYKDEANFSEKAFNTISDIVEKGNKNVLEIGKVGKRAINIPVTILVLLTIFAFYVIIPLIIVGLFFDFKYTFKGPDINNENIVNRYINTASSIVCKIKKDLRKGSKNG